VEGAPAPHEALRAIGRLEPGGPWIGFDRAGHEYRFVVGSEGEILVAPADADLLLALAIAHYAEAFGGGPPDLEATQADLSALVRHLMQATADAPQQVLLAEVLDAIDDGLAGDAVAGRLAAARIAGTAQVDPVELLLARAEELLRER
jgi:hypothetical protein